MRWVELNDIACLCLNFACQLEKPETQLLTIVQFWDNCASYNSNIEDVHLRPAYWPDKNELEEIEKTVEYMNLLNFQRHAHLRAHHRI